MSTTLIRLANDTNAKIWDEYVAENPSINPYCYFAWKKAVSEAYGFQGYYLYAARGDKVVGIFPLIHLKRPFGTSTLVSLPYCDAGGGHAEDERTVLQMLLAAMELGVQLRTDNLLVRSTRETYPHEFLKNFHYSIECGKVSMRLELPTTVDILWNGFKSKLRSQIIKAGKNGLVFQWADRSGLSDFYTVFSRNMRDLGSPVHGINWLRSIIEQYGPAARIGLIYKDRKAIGCGLILCGSKTVAIPWASTLREYNILNPNMLLYWNLIKFSIENNYSEFDFGRSTPGGGTYRFKKQWGASEHILYTHSFKNKSTNGIASKRQKISAIWSKLPINMANTLGPMLRKYISL